MITTDKHTVDEGLKNKSPLEFWGLILFIAYAFFAPENFFEIFGKVKGEYIIFILTFIVALIRGRRPLKSPQLIFIPVLALISVVSIVASPLSTIVESYVEMKILIKTITIFLLVTMTVRTGDDLRRLLNITIFFALIVCLISIYTLKAGIPPPATPFSPFKEGRLTNHFRGIGSDPNEFAAFLLLILPISFIMLLEKKSFFFKFILGIASFVFLISIAESQSRGGLIGLIFVLIFLIWEYRKKIKFFVFIGVLLVVVGLSASPQFWERASALKGADSVYEDPTATVRLEQFKYAFGLIEMFPILGVGMGSFVDAKIAHLGLNPNLNDTYFVTHNSYLQMAAEIGIPGLAIFISILFLSYRDFNHVQKKLSNIEGLADMLTITTGMKIGFIGYLITSIFLSQQYSAILYQWIGLSVATKALVTKKIENNLQNYTSLGAI